MPAISITLDTAPPATPRLVINSGEVLTGIRGIELAISTTSDDVTEMKIWGDVDPVADPDVQSVESASAWVAYATSAAAVVSSGSGVKRIYCRLRDDVGNETLEFTDSITLDTDTAVVSITDGVDVEKISKVAGFNEATFSWISSRPFTDYMVRAVPAANSPYTAGVAIGFAGGSTNVSGTGGFADNTPIITTIKGLDLATASPGSTAKLIKVFVKDTATADWSL